MQTMHALGYDISHAWHMSYSNKSRLPSLAAGKILCWNESAPHLRFPSMWVLIILPWGLMKPRWHLDAEARRAQLNAQ